MACNTYYLEMLTPASACLKAFERADVELVEQQAPDAALNRRLYLGVGAAWGWQDKAEWPLTRWQAYVAGAGETEQSSEKIEHLITVVLLVDGEESGYFELAVPENSGGSVEVEIRYFGLLPHALGQGLGGPLLSAAIERAWRAGASRVWVHTCDLDHPAALANYQKRGFVLYKTTTD